MSTATSLARLFPTTHRAVRRIAAKRRQTIAVVLDEAVKMFDKAQHPQLPSSGNHGPATDRNVQQGAPTPTKTTTDRTPILPADSTQHNKEVTASIEAGGMDCPPSNIQSPTTGEV